MKKMYSKPDFRVESFALTQSVAAGCGAIAGGSTLGKPSHWGKDDCGWDVGNLIIFVESNSACELKVGEEESFEGICYNNPDGGNSIFGSY